MKIIFKGTGNFAKPIFSSLIEANHNILSLFTTTTKSQDRKSKENQLQFIAKSNNINTYILSNLNKHTKILEEMEADIIVVVDYGLLIPKNILEITKYGCLNIHPSLLPKYRGAAPMQRALLNGETKTGVCVMKMDEGFDTGDVLTCKEVKIDDRTTFSELHKTSSVIGAKLLLEVLENIDKIKAVKQSNFNISYAPKLQKSEGKIDWNEEAVIIDRKVRALNPWPGVFFNYNGVTIKVIESEVIKNNEISNKYEVGQILSKSFDVACGKDIVRLLLVKPAGKKTMKGQDYLRGVLNFEVNSIIC